MTFSVFPKLLIFMMFNIKSFSVSVTEALYFSVF